MTNKEQLDNAIPEQNDTHLSHKDSILESKKSLETLKKIIDVEHPEIKQVSNALNILEKNIDNNIGKKEDIDRQINEIDDALSNIKNRIATADNSLTKNIIQDERDIVEQANIGRFEAASTISKNIQNYPGLLGRIMKFLDRTS